MLKKLKNGLLAGAACLALAAASPAMARGFVVALAPGLSKSQIVEAVRFASDITAPGETTIFLDGYEAKVLCRFAVPDKASFAHPKAKLKANGACVQSLFELGGRAPESGLRLPQTLRAIGEDLDLSAYDGIAALGSPVYHDPREPRFSMKVARVPSDAHIAAPRTQSPFSAQGADGLLRDKPVYFAAPNDSWRMNEAHGVLVERFWTLEVDAFGGELVSFSSDPAQTLRRAREGARGPGAAYKLEDNDKLEMIPVRIERFAGQPLYERELSETPPSADELHRAQNVEIGIQWANCQDCDLDIYVRPYNGAETLSFKHTDSKEGSFSRDFTSANAEVNGLESVVFDEPVDLTKLFAAVNLYDGSPGGEVTGEVRIAIGSKTYAAPFRIAAKSGNRGAGLIELLNSGKAPNAAWTVLAPLRILSGNS